MNQPVLFTELIDIRPNLNEVNVSAVYAVSNIAVEDNEPPSITKQGKGCSAKSEDSFAENGYYVEIYDEMNDYLLSSG